MTHSSLQTHRAYILHTSNKGALSEWIFHLCLSLLVITQTVHGRAPTLDNTGCFKLVVKLVNVTAVEAVIKSNSGRQSVSCGLWGLGRCTQYKLQYKIVYETNVRLGTETRKVCCPGLTGDNCDTGTIITDTTTTTRTTTTTAKTTTTTPPRITTTTTTRRTTRTTPPTRTRTTQRLRTETTKGPSPLPTETTFQEATTELMKATLWPQTARTASLRTPTIPRYSTLRPWITKSTSLRTTTGVITDAATTSTFTTLTASTNVATSQTPGSKPPASVCGDETPKARILSKRQHVQALPANITFVCQVLYSYNRDKKLREIVWLVNGEPLNTTVDKVDIIEGIGEKIAGENVRGTLIISTLTVVNASSSMTGDYVCQAKAGECQHNDTVNLGCPKLPRNSRTENTYGNSCCPLPKSDPHPYTSMNIAAPAILASLLAFVIIVLPIVVYKRSRAIQIWFKYWCGNFEDEDGKLYDVYVSFDIEDQTTLRFVLCNIRQFLQQNDYTAFVFPLDSQPGTSRADNIVEAMGQSRRVMLIFSERYRSCEWCRFEFLTAQRLFIDERLKIIPVLFQETSKLILKDKDFSTVLNFIPSIHVSTDWESGIPPSASKKLRLRMPKKRKTKEPSRRSCNLELRTCNLQS